MAGPPVPEQQRAVKNRVPSAASAFKLAAVSLWLHAEIRQYAFADQGPRLTMAYVPGVKNDLFISYAHVDNERGSHDTRWVSEFVRGFTVDVRQRLGGPKDFMVFFDESNLQAYHRLPILLENARQSAVFIMVLSPSYVSHDWTMKELREFAAIGGDTRRIIVVEKLPLEAPDPYPSEIEEHKRTKFWRTNEPESYAPSTLTALGTSAQYRQTLETLGHQVQQLLREMRRNAEEARRGENEIQQQAGERRLQEQAARLQADNTHKQEEQTLRENEEARRREAAHQGAEETRTRSEESRRPENGPLHRERELRGQAGGEQPLADPSSDTIASRGHEPARTVVGASMALSRNKTPAPDPAQAPTTLLDVIWPSDRKDAAARSSTVVAIVAAVALALSVLIRVVTSSPPNALKLTVLLSTLSIGAIAFHLVAVGTGKRLGTTSAIGVVLAILVTIFDKLAWRDIQIFVPIFAGMIAAAFALGRFAERGWRHEYRSMFVATLGASLIFMSGFLVAILVEEVQRNTIGQILQNLAGNFLVPALIIVAIVIGFSTTATAAYVAVQRLVDHRLTPPR
jgi:hypothetical protein